MGRVLNISRILGIGGSIEQRRLTRGWKLRGIGDLHLRGRIWFVCAGTREVHGEGGRRYDHTDEDEYADCRGNVSLDLVTPRWEGSDEGFFCLVDAEFGDEALDRIDYSFAPNRVFDEPSAQY